MASDFNAGFLVYGWLIIGNLCGIDVTGKFSGTSMNMARLRLICSDSTPCPVPRRDASISLLDSQEGSSGKIVIFGGLTGTGKGKDFLGDDIRFLTSLNDIWILDLDQVLYPGPFALQVNI